MVKLMFWILHVSVLLGCIADDNSASNAAEPEKSKTGYMVEGYAFPEGKYSYVIFTTGVYPNEVPVIKAGGNTAEFLSYPTMPQWIVDSISGFGDIKYSIITSNDTLRGTLFIPGRIPSVTVNGLPVARDTTMFIDSAQVYNLMWEAPANTSLFRFGVQSDLETFFADFQKAIGHIVFADAGMVFSVAGIGTPEIKPGSLPNAQSSSLLAFHYTEGRIHRGELYIRPSLPKKAAVRLQTREECLEKAKVRFAQVAGMGLL